MSYREMFPGLRPNWLSYNNVGLVIENPNDIDTIKFLHSSNPRLEFVKALKEFDQEEINSFQHYESGTEVQMDTKIGDGVKIGNNCVIGGSGFGYEKDTDGSLIRMPHLSYVEIQDNVTIHNNVNIDRGVLSPTIIGKGTVIDSLSHIAHGIVTGENCCIIAQAGIGGSCILGNNVYVGFGAHIKNKVRIGNNAIIGMGAVVLNDVPDGETWVGNPARKLEKSKFQQRLNEEINK